MVKIIPLIKNSFVFLKNITFLNDIKKNKNYVLLGPLGPGPDGPKIPYCVFKLINVTFTKPSVTEDKIFISFPVSFRNLKS